MRKYFVLALLLFLCYLLQSSVLPAIAFGGIMPNLLIIFVAACGFMNGEICGLVTGFVCGLLVDVFGGEVIGFYALVYMTTGYINGMFQRIFYPEDMKLPLILILGSDLGYGLLCYLLLFLLRSRLDAGFYLLHVILPEAVYTIVIAFAVYPLLLLIHKKLEAAQKGSKE
ncbi:MAG TPA: rod shape-determining protein MreD [Candidatus Eisenbergiella intestinipullorum]|nr:rod shape-determining protein MreD [Candidatus Eisenbergiella intestinipullorum]